MGIYRLPYGTGKVTCCKVVG